MTKEEIKAKVCELFEFGEDKWFDYEQEFITLAESAAASEREACELRCAKTQVLIPGHHEYTALKVQAMMMEAVSMRTNSNWSRK